MVRHPLKGPRKVRHANIHARRRPPPRRHATSFARPAAGDAQSRRRADAGADARPTGEDRHRPSPRTRGRGRYRHGPAPRAGPHQQPRHRHQDGHDRRAGALRVQGPACRPLQRERRQIRLRDDAVRPEPAVRARPPDRSRRRADDGQGGRRAAPRHRRPGAHRRRVRRSGGRSKRQRQAAAVQRWTAAARPRRARLDHERPGLLPPVRTAARRLLRQRHAADDGFHGDGPDRRIGGRADRIEQQFGLRRHLLPGHRESRRSA